MANSPKSYLQPRRESVLKSVGCDDVLRARVFALLTVLQATVIRVVSYGRQPVLDLVGAPASLLSHSRHWGLCTGGSAYRSNKSTGTLGSSNQQMSCCGVEADGFVHRPLETPIPLTDYGRERPSA